MRGVGERLNGQEVRLRRRDRGGTRSPSPREWGKDYPWGSGKEYLKSAFV